VFVGEEEPFSCSIIKCIIMTVIITKGIKKCREKKRFRVGWLIDGPPQIQIVISFPTDGIAERIPVITVAPQNDIWPHGRT